MQNILKGKLFLVIIYTILLSINSFSATRLIIVAPGQQFIVGSGLSGTPKLQTIGVPFSVTIYSIDDISNSYINTNASVTMSANNIASFNPVSFHLTQIEGGVSTCKRYPVEITINMISSGNITITATENGGMGLGSASVAIGAQKINSYTFNTISTQTAGQPVALTIVAQDALNNTVTSFSGTAVLTAYYSTGSYNLGTIQFNNGIYYGTTTLYRATNVGEQVYIECKSTTPNVTSNSNNFSINPGALDRLLIIGPGQVYEPGTLTGNGRVGGAEQTNQQTAGVYFYVTVRACDSYWNTRTADSFQVTMASSDSQVQFDSSTKNLSSGRAIFRVELRTVGTGYQYLTVTAAGVTYNSVTVPITHSTLNHFLITTNITNQIAGQQFQIQAVAVDAFNNTVTTFNQTGVTLQAWAGSNQIDANNWNKWNINFTNGVMSGMLNGRVVIYQKAFNVFLRLIHGSVTGDSNQFTVNSGSYSRLIFIAPGQQPDPGDSINRGVSGNPLTTTAGITYGSVSIVAVDTYGNKVTTINNIVKITSTDSQASIYGQSLPQYLTLVAGETAFNMVFRTSGNQITTGRDTQQSSTNATFSTNVYASSIHYFEISNIPSSVTAGNAVTSIIRAKDEFGNTKTDWTGIIYLSSPYTDWELPYESTMAVIGTSTEQYQYKWAVTFTAGNLGVRSLTTYFYRAVTWQAKLFVSTNFNDTPLSYSGYIGKSSGFRVHAANYSKLQVLAPGMEARPGTADGENNSPSGQAKGQAFTVTINLCDPWWNVVNQVHQINVITNDERNSEAGNPLSSTFPVSIWLSNGTALCPVKYNSESSTFKVIVSDVSDPSVIGDETPDIPIFEIFRIDITTLTGDQISNQVAGVPFWVSITAIKSPSGEVATGFNGVMELAASNNYSASEYTIEPTVSPQFVSGKCQVQITMYRASTTVEGGPSGGVRIKAKFSTQGGINESNTFNLWPSAPQKALIIIDGMTHKPGLTHVGIPFYAGYSGSPKIVKAGEGFDLKVYIVDQYYNIVYSLPPVNASLSSTDPYPASVDGINLSTNISIIGGIFSTNNMVLKTVFPGYQQITAAPSGYGSNVSPSIYVRHTALHHFDVIAPSGPLLAGNPFYITVFARDVYDNLCDDTNEAVPNPMEDSPDITLSEINLGHVNTIYPKNYKLSNGVLIAPVSLYKKGNNEQIMVSAANGVTGISNSIQVDANSFKRLLVITQGMTPLGGVYKGDSPVDFTLYTGMPVTRTVNDIFHSPSGYQFRIYSCDLYGNITATADVLGKIVTVTTNDPYAVPVTATTINSATGEAIVNVIFHTAMAGVTVGAHITDQSIIEFATPGFRTLPGDAYGLQLTVPGLYIVGGSGGPDPVTPTIWDNGVRGIENAQLSGVYFPVSIYACDMFGNTVSGRYDTVQLTSGDLTPTAEPSQSSPKTLSLINGFTWTIARLISPGYINMEVRNLAGDLNRIWKKLPCIYVTTSGQLLYRIKVNGIERGDGTPATTAIVYPNTFNMTVEVIDNYSREPVFGAQRDFILRPVTVNNPNIIANGNLGITSGSVFNGVFSTSNQTYTRAERIRIRVSDQLGELADATSCIIDFAANSLNTTFTLRADPAYIRAGTNSRIIARVVDVNNNPVQGVSVNYLIESGAGTLDAASATTNSNGEAFVNYTGPYINERAIIRGTYGSASLTTSVSVSLVNPILGEISNYPNPFRAGAENTNISFLLNEASEVKLKIYSLFGDSVYSKIFTRQEIERKMNETGNVISILWDGKNNKGDLVGNGGYICIVETVIDGQKKKLIRKIGVSK